MNLGIKSVLEILEITTWSFFQTRFFCCLFPIWEGLGWLQKIVKGIYWYTNHPRLFLKLLPLLDWGVCNKWPFFSDWLHHGLYTTGRPRPQTWASPSSKENKQHAIFCLGGRTWWICVDLKGRHVCWDIQKNQKMIEQSRRKTCFYFMVEGGATHVDPTTKPWTPNTWTSPPKRAIYKIDFGMIHPKRFRI